MEGTNSQINKLLSLRKPELEKLCKCLTNQEKVGTKEELVKSLIDDKPDEIKSFLDNYRKLRYVSIYRAIEYLKKKYPEKSKEISAIEKKDQFLIFMYENDLVNEIDHVERYASFRKKELRYAYQLKAKTDLKYEDIIERSDKFVVDWNENSKLKISIDRYMDKDNVMIISILREHHQKTYRQFKFRTRDSSNETNDDFEITRIKLYPISPERMEINKIGRKTFKIIFDFDPKSNRSIVNNFVAFVFGENAQLKRVEMEKIRDIQKGIKEAISKSPRLENIQSFIDNKKEPVISQIREDQSFTESKKEELIKIAESVNYAGSSFKDDSKTKTREFTMNVGDFPTYFSVLSTAKAFLQELFVKVSKSTDNQIIIINNKNILLTKTSIKFPPMNFSENELLVLKLFFGEEK